MLQVLKLSKVHACEGKVVYKSIRIWCNSSISLYFSLFTYFLLLFFTLFNYFFLTFLNQLLKLKVVFFNYQFQSFIKIASGANKRKHAVQQVYYHAPTTHLHVGVLLPCTHYPLPRYVGVNKDAHIWGTSTHQWRWLHTFPREYISELCYKKVILSQDFRSIVLKHCH